MPAERGAGGQVALAGTAGQSTQPPILSRSWTACLACRAPTDRLSAVCHGCRVWHLRLQRLTASAAEMEVTR